MSKPILFIIPGACSLGSQITLEWLDIPYQVGITTPEIRQTNAFRKVNPAGKVGALKDGDVVVGENLAILLYLVDNFTTQEYCLAKQPAERVKIHQWLSYLSSTLHPAFQHFNYPIRFVGENYVEEFRQLAFERLSAILDYIEQNLQPSGFFLGDHPTIVDAQAFALLRWCQKHNRGENLVDLTNYPRILQFLTQMRELSAVKNALLIENNQAEHLTNSKFAGYFVFD